MKKRGKLRLSIFLAAALLTLAGLWADSRLMLSAGSTRLEHSYRRALNDLTDYVSGLEATLEKAPYAGGAVMQGQISAKLLEQSGGAKAAMASLPLSQERTEKLSRFLSQTGDYALSLARRSASGGSLKGEDLENLGTLEEYAGRLSAALKNAQARLDTEEISLGRTESLLQNLESDDIPTLDDDFDQASEAFSQFPALLYDGPFSDHIRRREPLFLQNSPELSRDEAAQKAADFFGCSPEDLSYSGEGGGQLPAFSFTWGGSRVSITRAGGQVSYFKKGAAPSRPQLGYEDALREARRILGKLRTGPCRESYYVISDGLCTVNFAAVAETTGPAEETAEVLCYPDLIKVTVELEQGGMVEYDAAGYLMNHRDRALPLPALTAEEAAKSLSPFLTAQSSRLALIPTPGLGEVLCWEFTCTANAGAAEGKEFLVYVNGATGTEEQLYELQKDEHGILAN